MTRLSPLFDPVLQLIPAMGATNYAPLPFPDGLRAAGFWPRDASRNDYLGITVSRPQPDIAAVGAAYLDRKDGRHDEDIFSIDLGTGEIARRRAGEWVALHPEYSGTHHGDKSYLGTLDVLR